MAKLRYDRIPNHRWSDHVESYIQRGTHHGDWFEALVTANLQEYFVYADDINRHLAWEWTNWFHIEAPDQCWGSVEKVCAWRAARHNEGRARA